MFKKLTQVHVNSNPHNALGNLARYHIDTIESKLEAGQEDAIVLDATSAVIAMAFYNEALINYVGLKKLGEKWDESAPFAKKIKLLNSAIQLGYDKKLEPFKTVEDLKAARNRLAHGKPMNFVATVASKADITKAMQPPWANATEPEVAQAAFAQVKAFAKLLFQKAKIKAGAALTSAMGAA